MSESQPSSDERVPCLHECVEEDQGYWKTDCGSFYWDNSEHEQEAFTYCPFCGLEIGELL